MRGDIFNAKSPLGMYFNSNAEGLLQNVILNTMFGNPLAADDYWKDFVANVGYEGEGYGLDVGYNQPNPLMPGDRLDWQVTGKIPLDF